MKTQTRFDGRVPVRRALAAFFLLFTGAFIFIFVSCSIYEPDDGSIMLDVATPQGTGSFDAKTLVPGVSMVPASYDFHGDGPSGRKFDSNSLSLPAAIGGLKTGDWSISTNVKNGAGVVIATGKTSFKLGPGESKAVGITAKPVDGYGTIDLAVLWTPADVANPSIVASVVPFSGAPIPLTFGLPEAGRAVCVRSAVPTGYHTLVLQLYDGVTPVMGAVETVQIMNGQVTAGTFEFYVVNQARGSVSVRITPQMNEPLAVDMSGQVSELALGGSMSVKATVAGVTGNCVYAWYLNGEAKSTGQTYTFGSALSAGVYRLDVVGFTADGMRSGSKSYHFAVLETVRITLEWDANSEADLAGYKLHYGLESGKYASTVDVGSLTLHTLSGLMKSKTYYIAATAYNTAGNESDRSNEVIYTAN